MTVYIVTGDGPRCGSSMLMQALKAGGMEIAYDKEAEPERTADYNPNPGGRYELTKNNVFFLGFPLLYDGKAVKIFPPPWGDLIRIVAWDYHMVWLHRDRDARWNSFFKAHENQPLIWNDHRGEPESICLKEFRDACAKETLEIMHERRDVELIELEYECILEKPREAFDFMADMGWPINPAVAALIPNPQLDRFGKTR